MVPLNLVAFPYISSRASRKTMGTPKPFIETSVQTPIRLSSLTAIFSSAQTLKFLYFPRQTIISSSRVGSKPAFTRELAKVGGRVVGETTKQGLNLIDS